ncbi:MAG: hypothetical protein ACRDOK_12290 [Streptosporangiaceae bacterium]
MNELLKLAIDGHGGMRRWEQISRFRAAASITGAIWDFKGRPGLLEHVALEGETRDQRLKITPFPRPGRYATWEPYRQTIETTEGVLVDERRDPAAPFAGQTRYSLWDDFQVAYFAGEANWNYFTAPFVLARSDFTAEETEPWHEDGQAWRSLLVTYPDSIVAHTRHQTYYFDDTGLLRRLDYSVDILGGGPAVHYPSAYREFDGIMVPTRRRVYARNDDGSPNRYSVSIAIDITNVTFG